MTTDVQSIAAAIRAGGVIAYPTEGVWGLGCDPENETAVERILSLKGRRREQGLVLLAANEAQLAPFIKPLPAAMARRIRAAWPGPVTWIVPAADGCPDWLTGGRNTLAVRVSAHPPARDLALAAGTALVSTSANRHDEKPARDVPSLRALFGNALDAVLEAPLGDAAGPSEIRNAETGKVLRAATTDRP
ncbi:MAG: Sua5/YciO/YrdC/YwlC family protein [Gammaproteobacteria bacterium]|nr:Sua5/YciO/YrdC/YwlC family protein [Gammaproteobacteria bacterium]